MKKQLSLLLMTSSFFLGGISCKNENPKAEIFPVNSEKQDNQDNIDALQEVALEMNKKCPIKVDDITTADNVMVSGKNLVCTYILKGLNKQKIAKLKELLPQARIENEKRNPNIKAFQDMKVTFVDIYIDENRNFLFKIITTPEMYK